jgi:GntR family transcriptional regulator
MQRPVIDKLHLTPDSPIPIFLQLKSQFEYLIITGELPPGTRLPSIRALAQELRISPNTLVHAYRALEEAGLAVANPGSGFFVRGADADRNGHHREVRTQIRTLLHDAVRQGLGLDQVAQVFMAEVAVVRDSLARPEVMVLSKQNGRLDELTMRVREGLAGLNVQVTGVALEDVLANQDLWLPRLMGAEVVTSLLFDIRAIREVLEPRGIETVPILVVPAAEVRDRITHLPPNTRVGVVASTVEFIDGMITAITQFNPTVFLAGAAEGGKREEVQALLGRVDCVVYGTLTRQIIRELLPRAVEGIELLYVPDQASLQRLRGLLGAEVVS